MSSTYATFELSPQLMTAIEQVNKLNLSVGEKASLIGNVFIEWAGFSQRTFNYASPLSATAPGCGPTFARSFEHRDWVDGESVVQAEETSLEEGFNLRFHAIEDDLDALGADLAQAFVCLAELRGALAVLLQEIRTEINRINKDLHELRSKSSSPTTAGVVGGGLSVGQFAGVTKLFDKDVMIWQVAGGYQMLPMVELPRENLAGFGGYTRTIDVGAHVRTNPQLYAPLFEDNSRPTVNTILERIGDEVLPSGARVRDGLRTLPGDLRVSSPDALVTALVDREASSMRASGEAEVVTGLLTGIGREVERAGEVTVERFTIVPEESRSALNQLGVGNVDTLARRDPVELGSQLRDAGVNVDAGTVAGWVSAAALTSRLGR